MNRILHAAIVLAATLTALPALAQDRPVVTLRPADPPRWDAAGHVGWFGANKTAIAPEWNDWADSASFGAAAGYYLTPNVKIELDAATTTRGGVESMEPINVGGQFPTFYTRRHSFTSTTIAAAAAYQFLDNAWFHPFVGVGIEASRERARIESAAQFVPLPGGRPGTLVPAPPIQIATTYAARPVVSAGFKWYASERAFVRSDLRTSLSTDRAESVVWRVGVGFDF